MIRVSSFKICCFLLVIYSATTLAALLPVVNCHPVIAHAVTGRCAEDCTICGCDPLRSAARVCCCWENKKHERHTYHSGEGRICCKGKHAEKRAVITCPPCGGRQALIVSGHPLDQLPHASLSLIAPFCQEHRSIYLPPSIPDPVGDPPDPPPKVAAIFFS